MAYGKTREEAIKRVKIKHELRKKISEMWENGTDKIEGELPHFKNDDPTEKLERLLKKLSKRFG